MYRITLYVMFIGCTLIVNESLFPSALYYYLSLFFIGLVVFKVIPAIERFVIAVFTHTSEE